MTKYVKEIWVQFADGEAYSENEEKFLELLDKAQGECEVRVYIQSEKKHKSLGGYSFDETRLSLLTDAYGEENVRYQEKEIKWHRPKEVPKIKQILPCNDTMYALLTDGDGEQYKCKVLMYALCDDGEIYPLYFDRELAISPLSEAAFDVQLYEMENGIIYLSEGGKPDEQK